MSEKRLTISKEQIAEFCRRHRIRRLSLFGSVLRDDFREDSDVDILVEFEPGVSVGLRFFAMERELTEILGRRVDLNTPGFLAKYFRDEVPMKVFRGKPFPKTFETSGGSDHTTSSRDVGQ
ncbi:MAG: nucleotidyltransferase family protein [Thermodesulfobacteriota bacterium]